MIAVGIAYPEQEVASVPPARMMPVLMPYSPRWIAATRVAAGES